LFHQVIQEAVETPGQDAAVQPQAATAKIAKAMSSAKAGPMKTEGRRFDESNRDSLLGHERESRWEPPVFLKQLDLKPGQAVLDLGCGPGFWTLPLADAVGPSGTVWALDGSRGMLEALKRREPPEQVRTVFSELPEIKLPDRSIDFIWASFIVHELHEPAGLIKEMSRVLKPGGRAAVLEWRREGRTDDGPPAHHRIAASDLSGHLAGAGFSESRQIWQDDDYYMVIGSI
jgi:ubiquinone/menaquinone biosynthesis C-methylase UbiE